MNVIVANKSYAMLQNLGIDIIKSMEGEFDADYLISTFKNFFFQRMILDITAINNYKDITNLQKLSIELDMDKIILLLDDTEESSSPLYLSQLISMGIYNFTKNVEGVMYLYNNPNSYRDVAQYHQLGVIPAYQNTNVNSQVPTVEDNMSYSSGGTVYGASNTRIIGIKNVTKQAGATTLTYMMKKELDRNYKVVAVEVGKRDFSYFNDNSLISTTRESIRNVVSQNGDADVILVDINDIGEAEAICTEVIYLIEPSTIKLNKLMLGGIKVLENLKKKQVILNKSLLKPKDVLDFEGEAKIKILYNLPPLDEREKNNPTLNAFLVKLGFIHSEDGEIEKRKKILGIF